jgi:hypothetical protein
MSGRWAKVIINLWFVCSNVSAQPNLLRTKTQLLITSDPWRAAHAILRSTIDGEKRGWRMSSATQG